MRLKVPVLTVRAAQCLNAFVHGTRSPCYVRDSLRIHPKPDYKHTCVIIILPQLRRLACILTWFSFY